MPAKPRNRSQEGPLIEQTIRFADEATGAHNEDPHKKNIMWRMLHAGGSPKPQQGQYSPPQKYSKEVYVARPILKASKVDLPHEAPLHSSFDISPVEEESRFAKASPGRLMDWAREISPHDQSESYLRKISHWRSHSRSQSNSDKSQHRRKDSHLRGLSQTSVSTVSSLSYGRSPEAPPPPPEKDLKWRERSKAPVLPHPSSARSPLSPRFFQKLSFNSQHSSSSGSSGINMPPPPKRPQRPPIAPMLSQPMERSTSGSTSTSSLWQSDGRSRSANSSQGLMISTERERKPRSPPHKSPGTPKTPRTPRSPVVTKGKIRTRSRSGRNMSTRRSNRRAPAEDSASKKWSKAEADLRRKKGMGFSMTEDDLEQYRARGLPNLPNSKNPESISEWIDDIPTAPIRSIEDLPSAPIRSPDCISSPAVREVPRFTPAVSPAAHRDNSVRVNRRGRRKSIPSVMDDFRMQSLMADDSEDILKWLESFRPAVKPKAGSTKIGSRMKPISETQPLVIPRSSHDSSKNTSQMPSEASSAFSHSGSSSPDSEHERYLQPATPPFYDSDQLLSGESSDANDSTALRRAGSGRSNKQRRQFSIRIPSMAELPGHDLAQLSGLLPVVVPEDDEPLSAGYVPPNVDLSLLSPPACVSAFTPSSTRSPRLLRDGRSSTASSAGDAFMYDQMISVHQVSIQTNATARTAISNAMNRKEERLNDKRALLKLSAFGRSPIPFSPSLFGELNSAKTMVDLSLGGFDSPHSQAPKSALLRDEVSAPPNIIISESHDSLLDMESQTPVEMLTDAVYSRPGAQTIEIVQVDSPKQEMPWMEFESDNESEDSGSQCYDSSWEYPDSDEATSSRSSSKSLEHQIEALFSNTPSSRNQAPDGRPGMVRLSTAELRLLAGRNSQFPGDIMFGIMPEDII